jgi:chorismate synthase
MKGSHMNDSFYKDESGVMKTKTNHSGGIQGGISNGQEIFYRVAFKPTSTISLQQETVNKQGENVIINSTGRHDPCVLPRAVPIVESLTAITLLDLWLENKTSSIK